MRNRVSRSRELSLVLLFLSLVAGAASLVLPRMLRPPSLTGLDVLLAQRRFDEAERRLTDYLESRPDSSQAHVLMAQVALARKDQKPELALRHLRSILAADALTQAIVRLNEGNAYSAMGRYNLAEQAWRGALQIDPRVPEAGWALLGLYYIQGRREDAHRLAMKLHATEPDARDRAALLLELLRQDAKGLVYETIIPTLEPVVREHPEDFHTAIAYGLACVRSSRPDEGLDALRGLTERFPQRPEARDALMTGLEEAFRHDELRRELERLPDGMRSDPRFEKHRGALAQSQGRWDQAAESYRRAWSFDPSESKVLYRLSQVLRLAGRTAEVDRLEPVRRAHEKAREESLAAYDAANAVADLGARPYPEIEHRLAELRELVGRPDEALAWHRMVLKDDPEDAVSRAAVERLTAVENGGDAGRGEPGP
jgi:tetratricopeptide (TPR) repeat protein